MRAHSARSPLPPPPHTAAGSVFGGQLLVTGHEIAAEVAAAHAGCPCQLLAMQVGCFAGGAGGRSVIRELRAELQTGG